MSGFLKASRHLLCLSEHAENVLAGELLQVFVRPAAMHELSKERRIFRHVFKSDDNVGDSVEVTSDADVIRADNLFYVLDLIGNLADRRVR